MLESSADQHALNFAALPTQPSPRRRSARRELFSEGGTEPRLEDLLRDPLTAALMNRDGVSEASLRELISSTRRGLRGRYAEL